MPGELARQTLDSRGIDSAPYGPVAAELRAQWQTAAATAAQAIAAGGGAVGGTMGLYIHFVVRALGTFQGSLDHSSAGGNDVHRFLPGPGRPTAGAGPRGGPAFLDLAGLTWTDSPLFGWDLIGAYG